MLNVPIIKTSNALATQKIINKETSVPSQSPDNNITHNIYPQSTLSVYKDSVPNITHTSWFYINDVHGKMTNMERLYNITKEFDDIAPNDLSKTFFNKNDKVSQFKVSSGDIILGANFKHNQVASQFLNWSGFIASALGNHEMDVAEGQDMQKLLDNSNYKTLAINVEVDKNSPFAGRIEKSMIIEKDGINYGIIGIAPSDMFDRVKMNGSLKDIKVQNREQTIALVQQEVRKLQEKGINHIVVLSHGGNKTDKMLAQQVDGIDIIFGAHTHNLIKDVKEGENLFYSKTGEPIVITQAGKDGENCGILNVDFDENGVIKKVQNNVVDTRKFNRPLYIKDSIEKILGKPEVIGRVKSAVAPPQKRLIENNPHGNLIVDAMRHELDTDIALLNTGNIRGSFAPGPIDTRLISDITPFEDHMMILSLTEKQIIDAIKVGCTSLNHNANKPGILLVSGLKYKATKDGKLLEVEYIDRNNQSHKIDPNNPDPNKKYTVAADDFFATGGDNYLESNKHPDFVVKEFNLDKNKLACDYIKKLDQPIEIIDDQRVQIV